MSVQSFDSQTAIQKLEELAKPWPQDTALNQEYTFIAPPSFGMRLLCCVNCCKDAYSDEFKTAQKKTSETTDSIKNLMINVLVANHEKAEDIKKLCGNVVNNLNTYTKSWPKLSDITLDLDKIVHAAQDKLVESSKTKENGKDCVQLNPENSESKDTKNVDLEKLADEIQKISSDISILDTDTHEPVTDPIERRKGILEAIKENNITTIEGWKKFIGEIENETDSSSGEEIELELGDPIEFEIKSEEEEETKEEAPIKNEREERTGRSLRNVERKNYGEGKRK